MITNQHKNSAPTHRLRVYSDPPPHPPQMALDWSLVGTIGDGVSWSPSSTASATALLRAMLHESDRTNNHNTPLALMDVVLTRPTTPRGEGLPPGADGWFDTEAPQALCNEAISWYEERAEQQRADTIYAMAVESGLTTHWLYSPATLENGGEGGKGRRGGEDRLGGEKHERGSRERNAEVGVMLDGERDVLVDLDVEQEDFTVQVAFDADLVVMVCVGRGGGGGGEGGGDQAEK